MSILTDPQHRAAWLTLLHDHVIRDVQTLEQHVSQAMAAQPTDRQREVLAEIDTKLGIAAQALTRAAALLRHETEKL